MNSKKLLSLALGLLVAESRSRQSLQNLPPLPLVRPMTSATLSESATSIPIPSFTETISLATSQTDTVTETGETKTRTATTLVSSSTTAVTVPVDTTTTEGETPTASVDTSTATEAATTSGETTITAAESSTTTADETTTTVAATTTTQEAGCAQTTVLAHRTTIFESGGLGYDDDLVAFSVAGRRLLDFQNPTTACQDAPYTSIMPYWDDLYVASEMICGIGISYEVHQTDRGQMFTVEYYIGSNGAGPDGNHFTHGSSAIVGLQRSRKSQFSYNTAKSIPHQFYA
ncbi:hypothetical protein F53441_13439 [Fusarium austroafricanum]|uniref:Uncharacterized protein n=1 Tax=Fusarium austroafricanum TaxID=2364996 RepID=A0A8H4NHZ2_9HYPO|nr:hypothetical protein F53441_13439 [Fusarium austroafricanum]